MENKAIDSQKEKVVEPDHYEIKKDKWVKSNIDKNTWTANCHLYYGEKETDDGTWEVGIDLPIEISASFIGKGVLSVKPNIKVKKGQKFSFTIQAMNEEIILASKVVEIDFIHGHRCKINKKAAIFGATIALGVVAYGGIVAGIALGAKSCSNGDSGDKTPIMAPSVPEGSYFGGATTFKSGDTLPEQLIAGNKVVLSFNNEKPSSDVKWKLETDPVIEGLDEDVDYKFKEPESLRSGTKNTDYQKMFEVLVEDNFQPDTLYTITATDTVSHEILAKFTFRTPSKKEPFISVIDSGVLDNYTWQPATRGNDDIPNLGAITLLDPATSSGANGLKLATAFVPTGREAEYTLTATGATISADDLKYDENTGITLTAAGATAVQTASGDVTMRIDSNEKVTDKTYASASVTLKKFVATAGYTSQSGTGWTLNAGQKTLTVVSEQLDADITFGVTLNPGIINPTDFGLYDDNDNLIAAAVAKSGGTAGKDFTITIPKAKAKKWTDTPIEGVIKGNKIPSIELNIVGDALPVAEGSIPANSHFGGYDNNQSQAVTVEDEFTTEMGLQVGDKLDFKSDEYTLTDGVITSETVTPATDAYSFTATADGVELEILKPSEFDANILYKCTLKDASTADVASFTFQTSTKSAYAVIPDGSSFGGITPSGADEIFENNAITTSGLENGDVLKISYTGGIFSNVEVKQGTTSPVTWTQGQDYTANESSGEITFTVLEPGANKFLCGGKLDIIVNFTEASSKVSFTVNSPKNAVANFVGLTKTFNGKANLVIGQATFNDKEGNPIVGSVAASDWDENANGVVKMVFTDHEGKTGQTAPTNIKPTLTWDDASSKWNVTIPKGIGGITQTNDGEYDVDLEWTLPDTSAGIMVSTKADITIDLTPPAVKALQTFIFGSNFYEFHTGFPVVTYDNQMLKFKWNYQSPEPGTLDWTMTGSDGEESSATGVEFATSPTDAGKEIWVRVTDASALPADGKITITATPTDSSIKEINTCTFWLQTGTPETWNAAPENNGFSSITCPNPYTSCTVKFPSGGCSGGQQVIYSSTVCPTTTGEMAWGAVYLSSAEEIAAGKPAAVPILDSAPTTATGTGADYLAFYYLYGHNNQRLEVQSRGSAIAASDIPGKVLVVNFTDEAYVTQIVTFTA